MSAIRSDRQAAWLNDIFTAKAAQRGGIVRRAVRDVDATLGREIFLGEVRRRGYSVVENGGQFVIFCNREPLRRLA